ncbi:MAG: hypothetical protein CM1200mP39_30610 [Dehalococcoidia bacterium]|nr:MAG: hypothetical protein CM1200mP39_30610 [Dehalococcoidia bacterium]
MKTNKTVGMVGLGNMGHPIALNLIEGGYKVLGYEMMRIAGSPQTNCPMLKLETLPTKQVLFYSAFQMGLLYRKSLESY